MKAPHTSLIDQIYRPMEGRGILETPEMLSGLDGLGGQLASIPGGPGAEQFPQAILDQGIHKRTGIEAGIAGMIPAGFGPSIMDPGGSGTAELITEQIDPNIFASLNSGFEKPYSEDMSGGINAVADPITNNFMPLTPQQPTGGFDTTDSFGIKPTGSNPIMNNPIAPMPSMPTAPNTQPGHSHDDLLSGIGKLFEQYFPQQNTQQINQPATQPIFDAAGNSAPQQTQSNQVFGNMITPNFGGGY